MKYTEELKSKGFVIEIEKGNSDGEGYDLYLRVKHGDSYSESFFSLSHSKGYCFTSDIGTDCSGEGCDWEVDDEKLVCEYLGVEELKEI